MCLFSYASGKLIRPWNILDLIVSVRLFTQYPAKSTETGSANDSIVDTHRLMQDHLLFIVGLKLDITRAFYDLDQPKCPLSVDVSVSHVGNSSTRRVFKIVHPSLEKSGETFATCEIDDTIVSKVTRKPAAFPDWWIEKYGNLRAPKSKLAVASPEENAIIFSDNYDVEFEHIDHNKHTTTSAYVKFCFNAAFRNVQKCNYRTVTSEHFSSGMKTAVVLFFRESSFGDVLTIHSWENEHESGFLSFQCKNQSGELCCSMSVWFHQPGENVPGGRL